MTRLTLLLLATAIAAALLSRARRQVAVPGPDFREPYDEAELFV